MWTTRLFDKEYTTLFHIVYCSQIGNFLNKLEQPSCFLPRNVQLIADHMQMIAGYYINQTHQTGISQYSSSNDYRTVRRGTAAGESNQYIIYRTDFYEITGTCPP
jgi:hypothetical protein